MTTFIGEYTAKVDDKGRIVLPKPFKKVLSDEGDLRLVVKKDIFTSCLEVYTFSEWEKQSSKVKDSLNFFNSDHATFWREYMRGRAVVEPDEKIGRISIPKALLDSIGVTKEVVFCGVDYKIEIWSKENFSSSEISQEKYVALAESLSQMR